MERKTAEEGEGRGGNQVDKHAGVGTFPAPRFLVGCEGLPLSFSPKMVRNIVKFMGP